MAVKTYMRDGAVTGIMVDTTLFSPVEQLELYVAEAENASARVAALEADLRAALDIAEASAKECEKLRGALQATVEACEYCHKGMINDPVTLYSDGRFQVVPCPYCGPARAALAPVGEERGGNAKR